jgi:hypothetical protein
MVSTPVEMAVGIAQQRGLAELGHVVALRYGKSGCHALLARLL